MGGDLVGEGEGKGSKLMTPLSGIILLAGRLSSSTGHTYLSVILLGRCAGLGGVWFDSTAS